ncbi:hypothetical protein F4782DRAFT_165913 [Xylaria castorea]|nr:hypothetical protein F4782DRAFT_165913 [Xylaria castorea]
MALLKAATLGNRPHVISFLRSRGVRLPMVDPEGDDKYTNNAMDLAIEKDYGLCLHELLFTDRDNPWRPHIYAENRIPLETAVLSGKIISLEVLLRHMPRDWKKSEHVLLGALNRGESDVISVLLDHDWPIGHIASGTLPLDWAIKYAKASGRINIVRQLLEKSADPDFRNVNSELPLWSAVKCESAALIRLLMRYNADPALGNPKLCSALYLAVHKNKSELVAAILGLSKNQPHEGTRNNRSINQAVNERASVTEMTPLRLAIQWRNTDIVHMLLDAGANPNGGGVLESPLNEAIWMGALDLVKILLQRGADPNIITRASGGPFHVLNSYKIKIVQKASLKREEQSSGKIEEFFLSADAEIEAATAPSNSICEKHDSFRKKKSRIRMIANLLLSSEAKIDTTDYIGNTPLMRAILHENLQYAELLLELKASTNIQNKAAMTAAHYAAFWGSGNLMKKLINAGLDLHVIDKVGRTPLYCAGLGAIDDGQYESPTGKFNAIFDAFSDGFERQYAPAALTAVLKAGSKELFQKIIQIEGLDLNVPDRHGWTALDVATAFSTLVEETDTLRSMKATKGSMIEEPTGLSSSDSLANIYISSEGGRTQAWVTGSIREPPPNSVCVIRADHCVPPNKTTYFEVEVLDLAPDGFIFIGLCTEASKLTEHIGWRRGTWGYRSSDGMILTGNEELIQAPPYMQTSTVGVVVDMVARKACFVLDNLWKSQPFDIDGQLYPAVGFTWRNNSMSKVSVNFGPEHGGVDFKYRPADDLVDAMQSVKHEIELGATSLEFREITGWKGPVINGSETSESERYKLTEEADLGTLPVHH